MGAVKGKDETAPKPKFIKGISQVHNKQISELKTPGGIEQPGEPTSASAVPRSRSICRRLSVREGEALSSFFLGGAAAFLCGSLILFQSHLPLLACLLLEVFLTLGGRRCTAAPRAFLCAPRGAAACARTGTRRPRARRAPGASP